LITNKKGVERIRLIFQLYPDRKPTLSYRGIRLVRSILFDYCPPAVNSCDPDDGVTFMLKTPIPPTLSRLMQRMGRAVAALMCLCVAGCAPGAVEKDLVNYINQEVLGVVAVEQAALERFADVSGENYVSDRQLYTALKHEVVPTFTDFVNVLHGIEPETDTVKRLHARFINGAEYRLRGFQTIMGGLRSQDAQVIRAANRLLDEGSLEIGRWRLELQQLYETYGIRQRTP
jgi:hypothetical protein